MRSKGLSGEVGRRHGTAADVAGALQSRGAIEAVRSADPARTCSRIRKAGAHREHLALLIPFMRGGGTRRKWDLGCPTPPSVTRLFFFRADLGQAHAELSAGVFGGLGADRIVSDSVEGGSGRMENP